MQVSVTLDQAQWQLAINVLARAPFNEVAPLVLTIQSQLAQGLGIAPQAQGPVNGGARPELPDAP